MVDTPPTDRAVRFASAALGGVIGPIGFVGAWIASAATTSVPVLVGRRGDQPARRRRCRHPLVDDRRIRHVRCRPADLLARALRSTVAGWAWTTAAATGIATLAVAATPLDRSDTIDTLHGAFATIGYVTLAATPLLAARPLQSAGHRTLAGLGVAAGVTSAVALALTPTSLPTGLFQRLGLTASDIWIVSTAIAITTGRLRSVARGGERPGEPGQLAQSAQVPYTSIT